MLLAEHSMRAADEVDAIAPQRETAQREMERRIVAQMLTCMDNLAAPVAHWQVGVVMLLAEQALYDSDEVDAIAVKRETAQREMEQRIVAQMLTCMDDLAASHLATAVKLMCSRR